MRLLSIEIQDCFKYGNTRNVFKFRNPLTLIVGDNGAGKSSIFEAVSFALFEKTIRWGLTHDEIIRRGKDYGVVILSFEKDGLRYMIRRARGAKTGGSVDFKCITTNKDLRGKSIKTTNEEILKTIGITFEAFKNSVLFGQNDLKKIVSLQPAERLELLASLLNLGMLNRCYDAADTKVITARSRRDQLVQDISSKDLPGLKKELRTTKELKELLTDGIAETKKKFKGVKDKVAELQRLRGILTQAKSKIKQAREFVNNQELRIERMQEVVGGKDKRKLPSLEKKLEHSKKQYTRLEGLENMMAEVDEKILEIKEEIATLKERARTFRYKIKQLKRRKRCVECNRPFDEETRTNLVGVEKKKLNEIQKQLDSKREVLSQKVARVKKYKEEIKKINALPDPDIIKDKIISIEKAETLSEEIDKMQKEIKTKKRAITQYKEVITEIKESGYSTEQLEEMGDKLLELKGKLSANKSKVGQANKDIAKLRRKIDEVKKNQEEVDLLNEKLEILKFVAGMFSKAGGLKQVLVENVLPRLNAKINEYLGILTREAITAEFTTTAKTKGGKIRDKLDIKIWTPKGVADFESYSGGEKQTIVLAMGLGFAELAAESVGADCKFILLDEVFASLDDETRKRLINLIYALQRKFENIVVVSHLQELRTQMPDVITIKRRKGLSRIYR